MEIPVTQEAKQKIMETYSDAFTDGEWSDNNFNTLIGMLVLKQRMLREDALFEAYKQVSPDGKVDVKTISDYFNADPTRIPPDGEPIILDLGGEASLDIGASGVDLRSARMYEQFGHDEEPTAPVKVP